jgi:hypothetical protein
MSVRFLPPVRRGEDLRKEARRNFVAWACFVVVILFLSLIRHRHPQWLFGFLVLWAAVIALITVFDFEAGWSHRGQPLTITPDRDEAHRA